MTEHPDEHRVENPVENPAEDTAEGTPDALHDVKPPHPDDLPTGSDLGTGFEIELSPPGDLATQDLTAEDLTAEDLTAEDLTAEDTTASDLTLDDLAPMPDAAEPAAEGRRRARRPGPQGQSEEGAHPKIRPWHVVLATALVFIPLFVWFVASLTQGVVARPLARSGSSTALSTASAPAATSTTTPPSRGSAPGAVPPLESVPSLAVTPVKPGARSMRFEAHGPAGVLLQVSFTDGARERHDYPLRKGPVAFEVPVTEPMSKGEYLSIRVRAPYTANGQRAEVFCRIFVDDVLVTYQQDPGTATCYISPYYDVRRQR